MRDDLFTDPDDSPPPIETTTGRSERTPYKHTLFTKLLGREVGVSTTSKFDGWNVHIIDLCSGDGVVGPGQRWSESCSPGITAKHASYAARKGKRVFVWGHEKNTTTFDALLESLAANMPELGYTKATAEGDWWNYRHGGPDAGSVQYHVHCLDSSQQDFPQIGKGDFVFVLNDPNSIHRWAANASVIRRMASRGAFVTTMHTMGCNVGGLLRLDYETRMGWNRYIDDVLETYDRKRQACLVACLDGDASRWGYLVTYPAKWVPQLRNDMLKSFENHKHPLRVAKHGETEFGAILDYLILTESERDSDIGRRRSA